MINYIELGGEKRPIKFGFWALAVFCDKVKIKLEQLDSFVENLTLMDTIVLIHTGLQDGARVEKKEFNIELTQIADWLEARPEALTEAFEVYSESKKTDEKAAPTKEAKKN